MGKQGCFLHFLNLKNIEISNSAYLFYVLNMPNFQSEKEWQVLFYNNLRVFDGTIPIIEDNTDWVIRWTLIEFKLSISNINNVLFQTIKYLSRMRNLGKKIPSQILLISLNNEKAYLFKSEDFLKGIETQYIGWASKDNKDFTTAIKPETISYKEKLKDIVNILENNEFIKVHVDKYNIVWLSKAYYEIINDSKNIEIKIEKKYNGDKLKFVSELVEPKYLNIFSYASNSEEVYEKSKKEFPWLIDCLNDKFLQKELWAFYTPDAYVQKATELLRLAISQIPAWNDYIILDRCAGTGQLENFLSEEELSHCILSTYETWEWNVLYNKFIDKVRLVIPPEASAENSLVSGWDALSEHFILWEKATSWNQIIMENLTDSYKNCIKQLNEYVANTNCNIIIFENPPYRDSIAENIKNNNWKVNNSFVYEELLKWWSDQALHRDISNLFIWSAWQYYLKKENDFLVLFSPIKYWKSLNLVNKKFIDWYWFNRKHFHASDSFISCILWKNIDEHLGKINLKCYDLENNEPKNVWKKIEIKKVYKRLNEYNDRRTFENDENWICCESNWLESLKLYKKKPLYNKNIIAYLVAIWWWVEAKHINLTRWVYYTALEQSFGFYLRSDNFINKLPLFCAKLYPQENWYERDVYFTTADRWEDYLQDTNFLKSCLIFTCLSQRNKCLSFVWSDNRFYKNELCFWQNTLSDEKLKAFSLNHTDVNILNLWKEILIEAKETKNYKTQFTYWLYQIIQELNTYKYNDKSHTKEEIKKLNLWAIEKKQVSVEYLELNTKIDDLKRFLKEYYITQIQDKLFEYELLK